MVKAQQQLLPDYSSSSSDSGGALVAVAGACFAALTATATTILFVAACSSGMLLLRSSRRAAAADPRDPPHVVSWIPFLGSGVEMGKDNLAFLRKYRQKFGGAPVFSATVLGVTNYFIVDSKYTNLPYKNIPQLDTDSLIKTFIARMLGVGDQRTEEIVGNQPLIKKVNGMYFHYFFKAEQLRLAIEKSQNELTRVLQGFSLCGDDESNSDRFLHKFVSEGIWKMSVVPLLSESLRDESLLEEFYKWESGISFSFAGAPDWLLTRFVEGRENLYRALMDPSFVEQGTELVKRRAAELPLSREDLNRTTVGLIFAAVANSMSAIFWLLYHVLKDKTTHDTIRQEVRAVKGYPYTLEQLDSMVFLGSAFQEVARMYAGLWTPRLISDDVEIEMRGKKYLFRKGGRLMVSAKWLHHDPCIHEDPETFIFDRFVEPKEYYFQDGTRVPEPVRQFGGGQHVCPGRKFVSYEAKAFVARLLTLYDMELLSRENPGIAEEKQGIGVDFPKGDVRVRFSKRSS